MLNTVVLAAAIDRMAQAAPLLRERLNEADRQLGDGDTGMTVERVVIAMQHAAHGLPSDIGAALASLSAECSRATGSSLGSVIAIGLAAAARRARGQEQLDTPGIVTLLHAAIEAIQTRSGAQAGDKTMLDSLIAITQALEHAPADRSMRPLALGAASAALDEFRMQQSRLGRARVYGDKSIGHDDPGMVAVTLLLGALDDALDSSVRSGPSAPEGNGAG
jgi:dihydroxyacetone kinase-like protein